MTELTAEVKKTTEACQGTAGLAEDIKAMGGSLLDIREQLQLIQQECKAETSKAAQLASSLQNTCQQVVTEMHKLSAQVTAALPLLQHQPQPVAPKAGSKAGPPCSSEALNQQQALLDTSQQGQLAQQRDTEKLLQKNRSLETARLMRCNSDKKAAAQVAGQAPAIRHSDGKNNMRTERTNNMPKAPVHPTAASVISGICMPDTEQTAPRPSKGTTRSGWRYQGGRSQPDEVSLQEPDFKRTPWHIKATASKHPTRCPSSERQTADPSKAFQRKSNPEKVSCSRAVQLPSQDSPSSAPSLHLTLQPLRPSSMHMQNQSGPAADKGHQQSSGAAPAQQGDANHQNERSFKRHKAERQSMGLDAFTKLFAQADAVSSQAASDLPAIQEEDIAREISNRILMQRMRRMQA